MTDSEKIDLILEKISTIDNRIRKVEITLEDETNRNIQLIAEGQMSLDRKLAKAPS